MRLEATLVTVCYKSRHYWFIWLRMYASRLFMRWIIKFVRVAACSSMLQRAPACFYHNLFNLTSSLEQILRFRAWIISKHTFVMSNKLIMPTCSQCQIVNRVNYYNYFWQCLLILNNLGLFNFEIKFNIN